MYLDCLGVDLCAYVPKAQNNKQQKYSEHLARGSAKHQIILQFFLPLFAFLFLLKGLRDKLFFLRFYFTSFLVFKPNV